MAVYEIVLFFNEAELAELHLHETASVVDRWVVVEATETFRGKPKPLNWPAVVPTLGKLAARVDYVVVDSFPKHLDCWGREYYSREAGLRGLTKAVAGDWVLVSDADEIPRPEAVARYDPHAGAAMFELRQFEFWLNAERTLERPMRCNRMATLKELHRLGGVQALRRSGGVELRDAGWHFSYMGGADRVRLKVGAYAHAEYDTPAMRAPGYAERLVGELRSLNGEPAQCETVVRAIDATFPRYLCDHMGRFAHLIRRGE